MQLSHVCWIGNKEVVGDLVHMKEWVVTPVHFERVDQLSPLIEKDLISDLFIQLFPA
jgi:hypothetical protein